MEQTSPKYSGEPTVQSVASGLASLGRYGDTYMVHAAEGETVVPSEILDANPELKNQLFAQMRMMGIKDPNRYVVGNSLNSINPITGQPEFFFKKAFKAVKRIIKKAAPIIVPIVGNAIAPGVGGPLASALMTKLQGGSMSDAFKSAAMAYAGQAVATGAARAFSQGSTMGYGKSFLEGLKQGALSPIEAAGNIFSSGPQNPLAQGIFGPRGANVLFRESARELGQNKFAGIGSALFPSYQGAAANYGVPQTIQQSSGVDTGGSDLRGQYKQTSNIDGSIKAGDVRVDTAAGTPGGNQTLTKDQILDNVGFTGDRSLTSPVPTDAGTATSGIFSGGAGKVIKNLATSPMGIAGLTAAGVYFLTPEGEVPDDQLQQMSEPQRSAYDKYLALKDKNSYEAAALKRQAGIFSPYADSPQTLADIAGISLADAQRYLASFAGGGEVIGPGTGTSDDVNAKLSDGEFVMTAKAVRNAGGGDRNVGAARMYDLMRRFEGGPAYG
mgnify:CR=1 FL=1